MVAQERGVADYKADDWLHAKSVSMLDAQEFARALRSVSVIHVLWPAAERFAAYCDAGGFVFASSETDPPAFRMRGGQAAGTDDGLSDAG